MNSIMRSNADGSAGGPGRPSVGVSLAACSVLVPTDCGVAGLPPLECVSFLLPRRRWCFLTASRRSRGGVSYEVGVGQPIADDLAHGSDEPGHVLDLSVVEPKDLLIKVTEHMERLDRNAGAFYPTLQQPPEVVQRVSVDLALGV